MIDKRLFFIFTFIFCIYNVYSQDCKIKIKGIVFDEAPETPLPYVSIFIEETSAGGITDEKGNFSFENLCVGEYHFIFSHIGCEDKKIHLEIKSDTNLIINLSHSPMPIGTVYIEGKRIEIQNKPSIKIGRNSIEENGYLSLSGMIEKIAGVHLIKNGSGISKPVIHGMFGNRLTILNNGIAQSGQQWGNDHSPEIDPFSADKITILKGASTLEFGGGNFGSIILIEPKRIEKEPHLHGQLNYVFETNGRGHSFNTRLEKYNEKLSWRINGTLKKAGDKKTADYFLNNTGVEEKNLSLQLEKSWKDRLFVDFYFSTFNTKLGILRGSHIGNLTDLEYALQSSVPLYTESNFSYEIDAPSQKVAHHLSKLKAKYYIDDNQTLEIIFAGQLNNRKEFDVRRGGRSEIPSMSLSQFTFNGEVNYVNSYDNNWKWKIGNQTITTDNTNLPETGILPLIPDYLSLKNGIFTTLTKIKNSFNFNFGVRYDYEFQDVLTISNSLPREIIRYENNFQNLGGLFDIKYIISNTKFINWNIGYAMRNPAVNELYSNGLHQGVSGIEEGDVNLKSEKSIKNTIEYQWAPNTNFSFQALAYHHQFQNYIYLNPQDEIRLTIRGAFPVFKYEQTKALLYGLDISSQFTLANQFFGQVKYSFIKGIDQEKNNPLIFIPPNSASGNIVYRAKKSFEIGRNLSMNETEIEANYRIVFKQNNFVIDQDFKVPPPTYQLFGLKISSYLNIANRKLKCFARIDNLFNTSYRDYLNRLRYFADDNGISCSIGVQYKF